MDSLAGRMELALSIEPTQALGLLMKVNYRLTSWTNAITQHINVLLESAVILPCRLMVFLGLVTYPDGTHGVPRNEGYFENFKMKRAEKAHSHVYKGQQAAEKASLLIPV